MRWLVLAGLWVGFSGVRAQEADSTRWWDRDLLDFSGDGAEVTVNPFMDLRIGGGSNGTVFENNRGARFEAVIDGEWRVRGTLQERQGAADPLTSYWAHATSDLQAGTVALPGWGRAKWIDRTSYQPGTPLRFDASRATTTLERQVERLEFRAGLDHQHEGSGRGSAFWSRNAAPLPFVGLSRKGAKWHAGGWVGSAIGSERGPLGATAESLYARQRVSRVGVGMHGSERWSTDVLWYRMARVPFGSESRYVRHWGGVQGAFSRGPFSGYFGVSMDWAACFRADGSPRWMGEILNVNWHRPNSLIWAEWHRARAGSASSIRLDGSYQLPLLHSATPLAHFWGDGVSTLSCGWSAKFFTHWSVRTQFEQVIPHRNSGNIGTENTWSSTKVSIMTLSCARTLSTHWPIALVAEIQYVEGHEPSLENAPYFGSITHSVGLSHKIHGR